jgi:hypothetical protein
MAKELNMDKVQKLAKDALTFLFRQSKRTTIIINYRLAYPILVHYFAATSAG